MIEFNSEIGVQYQELNPTEGGGTYLLRFKGLADPTPCLLIDSGAGVDVDAALNNDEYLAGVLLTHAHIDHYASLSESLRDGAPIYTSPATAKILREVLPESAKNGEISSPDDALDALTPVEGWTTVISEVEIAPVPAGHTPGATGFIVKFTDGVERNLLFTGDFTTRPVAGYPGFPTELPVDIDVVFATVSTASSYETELNDSIETILKRAMQGSSVLVTARSLTAVHYAYLLGHLINRLNISLPVRLAGLPAKLYENLGYEVPNIDTVPVFDSTDRFLNRETVTIAGPEVPHEGSSGRLFEEVRDDPEATVVQLLGGLLSPIQDAGCTIHSFEVINHPSSLSEIDELVTSFNPKFVVAGHGPSSSIHEFRGRYSERFVYAETGSNSGNTLYEDGSWNSPDWLPDHAVRSIKSNWQETFSGKDSTLPSVSRLKQPALVEEGVMFDRLEDRFGQSSLARDRSTSATMSDSESLVDSGSSNPTDPTGSVPVQAIDAGDGVTLLRVLSDDVDLDHGAELQLDVPEEYFAET